jgi:hypothetical protein
MIPCAPTHRQRFPCRVICFCLSQDNDHHSSPERCNELSFEPAGAVMRAGGVFLSTAQPADTFSCTRGIDTCEHSLVVTYWRAATYCFRWHDLRYHLPRDSCRRACRSTPSAICSGTALWPCRCVMRISRLINVAKRSRNWIRGLCLRRQCDCHRAWCLQWYLRRAPKVAPVDDDKLR